MLNELDATRKTYFSHLHELHQVWQQQVLAGGFQIGRTKATGRPVFAMAPGMRSGVEMAIRRTLLPDLAEIERIRQAIEATTGKPEPRDLALTLPQLYGNVIQATLAKSPSRKANQFNKDELLDFLRQQVDGLGRSKICKDG